VAGTQTQSKDQENLHTGIVSVPATNRKLIPPTRDMRGFIRKECWSVAATLDRDPGLSHSILEAVAQRILGKLNLSAGYLGWTMVVLASEFWRDQVAAVPHSRRLLLLPLEQDASTRTALAELRAEATRLGLAVATTESSSAIMQLLLGGGIEAIVGVANLDVLEKSLDKILLVGIPALAVPLLSEEDGAPIFDADWVRDMLHLGPAVAAPTMTPYRALMQAARDLFEPAELSRLLPRQRSGPSLADVNGAGAAGLDPLAATETIAHDFLALGGKYARPFITLAAYDAMTRGDDNSFAAALPDAVRRVAISIETFHKASLVHDDIEDADDFRYGQPSLHRAHGLPTAINVGDYMIGLGYSLVSREAANLGPAVVGDILQILSDAHVRLSEGQGAELLWRDARDKQLTSDNALAIYALKTSPAFEAALLSGLRCAGTLENLIEPLRGFCRHLGIAFQILNDLKDWQGDRDNKLEAGLDTLGGRPTVLWALALERLTPDFRGELLRLAASDSASSEKICRVRELYQTAGVFDKATRLVREHQALAESISRQISPVRLRHLLQYLVEVVLDRSASMPEC
jgi:geranylgeranyl diphosphate synthase, type II